MADWKDLKRITGDARMVIERVRIPDTGISIEGAFDPPPLAQLSLEDQIFVTAFIKSHGSIKEMERLFGISYPTVKNRLNKIAEVLGLDFSADLKPPPIRSEILDRLERGEITVHEATEALRK